MQQPKPPTITACCICQLPKMNSFLLAHHRSDMKSNVLWLKLISMLSRTLAGSRRLPWAMHTSMRESRAPH